MSAPRRETAPGCANTAEADKANHIQRNQFCDANPGDVKWNYPDPETVFGRVLGAHLSGDRLTVADSLHRFGHDRLSDSEFKLKRLGWPIKSIRKSVKTTDGGREAHVAEYYLDAETIVAAGERGHHYAATCERINAERRRAA